MLRTRNVLWKCIKRCSLIAVQMCKAQQLRGTRVLLGKISLDGGEQEWRNYVCVSGQIKAIKCLTFNLVCMNSITQATTPPHFPVHFRAHTWFTYQYSHALSRSRSSPTLPSPPSFVSTSRHSRGGGSSFDRSKVWSATPRVLGWTLHPAIHHHHHTTMYHSFILQ